MALARPPPRPPADRCHPGRRAAARSGADAVARGDREGIGRSVGQPGDGGGRLRAAARADQAAG